MTGHVVVGKNYHSQLFYHWQGSFTLTLKRYLWKVVTIRNPVTFRQVLRNWHHRPIFLALESLQLASFFLFLPIPNLANVLDIGIRKFVSQSNQRIKTFRAS